MPNEIIIYIKVGGGRMERFRAFFNFPLLFYLRKKLGMGKIWLKHTNRVLWLRAKWSHPNFILSPPRIRVYFRVYKFLFMPKNAGHNGTVTVSGRLGKYFVFLWLKQKKVSLRRIPQGKLPTHGMIKGEI